MSRVKEWIDSVPICTLGLFSVNIFVHIAIFVGTFPVGALAIQFNRVVVHYEVVLSYLFCIHAKYSIVL